MRRFLYLILAVVGLATVLLATAQADPPSISKTATPVSAPTRTGETRYGWKWLATLYDKDGNASVIHEEFPVPSEDFVRLDRNWDGKLTPDDFDWSEDGTLGWQKDTTFALFKEVDTTSEGRITPEEWQAVFAKAADEKGYLTDRELEELIFLPRVLKAQRQQQKRLGRMQRQIASGKPIVVAPKLGEIAPDFELHSPDGLTSVRLSSFRDNKPVALIFGSFT